jgi:Copper fist DNA binding domain
MVCQRPLRSVDVSSHNPGHRSESCIKGHRSSSCHHSDRPLFEIKKKGRPVSQCSKCRELRHSRKMHSKCECKHSNDNEGSRIPLPSTSSKCECRCVISSVILLTTIQPGDISQSPLRFRTVLKMRFRLLQVPAGSPPIRGKGVWPSTCAFCQIFSPYS